MACFTFFQEGTVFQTRPMHGRGVTQQEMAQTLLAKQKIIQMSVTIEWLQKKHVEQEDWLYLYNSMIETPQGSYAIHDIFDISFKWQPDQIGYLYLHTASGVRTFHIKTDPLPFVDCFKKMQTPY